MNKNNRLNRFLLLGGAVVTLGLLSACQTTGAQSDKAARDAQIDAILAQSAADAEAAGRTGESLLFLEKMYKRNSDDPDVAVRYGRALREAGDLQRAGLVVGPFARDEDLQSAAAKIEFSSIQAAQGNYMMSEEFARQAVLLDPAAGQAYHLLGIALDAQGRHQQSEVAFRRALDNWEGDPGPILNNLGLNLATQGFFDEALAVLRKAKAASPGREEIERNLRIVTALSQQPHKARAKKDKADNVPTPDRKPEA